MTPAVEYTSARLGPNSAGTPFRVSLDAPGADVLLAAPRAIYIAYTRDGQLHYIGKVDRRAGKAVAARLREHTRSSGRKRSAWRWLWVVPIAATMSARNVLELERNLIRLYQPPGNVQHARIAS
ncbi:MAG TPA: GIY-YIG nuclease family protein [Plantibacter sp.]|uniref:GIY-YIG nuclease family protein n=1 Tax=Plantibacter sp. TaxID=1871045 RepID=UPI002B897B75|nr:GIY-YIG nuclease family protein [Plantibacter sp.]